ncbi:lymphocyte-specific protein 1-like [Cottoperca gobio]|uniref:Lymphocyte-specific protein 1-like n=1 Tax=Cottoperca gobio TaxID=56716 RepID=A0A6J2PE60_COTGO|nr:lymphocyte-specific protein 1-like [Cottoperca gobio]
MSESIRRKSSSRQLLQNLISLTAERSQEDAEEVERERRRRARETQGGEGSPSWPEPPQPNNLTHNTELDEELKPRRCFVLEEDEGFSDWSQRLENRNEQEVQDDCRARVQRPSTPQGKPEPEEEKQQGGEEEKQQEGEDEKQQERKEEVGCEPEQSSRSQEASTRPPEKMSSNKKEVRTSYSSTVFLPQDSRLQHAMGQPADRTSYLVAGTMRPRGRACRVDGEVEQEEQKEREVIQAALQREWRSEETHQRPRDEDDQEEEELSFTHEEKDRREQKHMEEEEHKISDQRSMESRRSEEVNRRSAASLCSTSECEEPLNYGPMSPTFKKLLIQFYPDEVNSRVSTDSKCKIIERTESLRKSTSNIKKTLPPASVSKIDKKLELYTHALEVSSKEGRSGSQVLTDLMSPTQAVSSKKNLFEAGEAWTQNTISITPSKDADGLKVGVADLINQWVKGSEDGSRCSSPSRPAECSAGKRYKFVVAGHGKYEKVSVDDCSEDANCQSAGQFYEDL